MPFITIELLEGRSEEQIKAMVQEVTEAVSKNTNAPKENIHVFVEELKHNRYGVGGTLKSDEN
ncbi:2-hydroxymuconate tautomerase [Macrococcus equipercicus]|uniref:Tautomerase n=1 Tax=Macrococcus equipercicus TaxID=69967 RepID=A0A9Q9F2F6_9STAP|nr:2-hydroxymuconate tautomerase [Macrococcus equipercicus]KAA1040277.1 4-oxalocrotonate tautomerase [Macrococcus equipercicus]UTH12779.1 4-oxalocrotonate tautomerase [Macrococcus equipercicus]